MRIKTGVPGLDELIEGGLVKNHVYLVTGPPGSGRSTFGIQFLIQGASQNEKGLYIALTESPTNVIRYMSRFKFNLVNYVKDKKIFFMDYTQELFEGTKKKPGTVEPGIFDLGAEPSAPKGLFEKIEPIINKTGIERLVIDSTTALSFLSKSRDNEVKQIAQYLNNLKQLEVTSLLLSEQLEERAFKFEHYLSHGIIELHHFSSVEKPAMSRAIQILKIRGTKHDSAYHPIVFSENGLQISGGGPVAKETLKGAE
ncbi:RAD55 family ATPase [[Eubacterium] cellulosolvens]